MVQQHYEYEATGEFMTARSDRHDKHLYRRFNEADSVELTAEARRVHAESYLGENFITESAITTDGSMTSDLDKARGDNVDYYVGYRLDENGETYPVSTIRKVHVPLGGSVRDLPAYSLSADQLSDEDKRFLETVPQADVYLKELSAFGHLPEVNARSGLELLRTLMQEAQGTGEIWFFTMVEEKLNTLVNLFGPQAVRKIGQPIANLKKDSRVQNVDLVPAIVHTGLFFDQILTTARQEADPAKKKRYLMSLKYFLQGMKDHEIGDELNDGIATLTREIDDDAIALDLMKFFVKTTDTAAHDWSPPVAFDLSNRLDRRELRRRADNGEIAVTIDPSVADELFEMRHPDLRHDAAARREFVESHELTSVENGSWFYFPWDKSLVHYLTQADHQDLRTYRNKQLVNDAEQKVLLKGRIAIAGLSVGASVVQQLLYSGIGGSYAVADFDELSLTNTNRVRGNMGEVGIRKLTKIAQEISRVDPYVEQVHLPEGVTASSVDQLADFDPAIIFDEVDDMQAKARLRALAADKNIPLVMVTDVGHRSVIDIERHDLHTVKPFNGRLSVDQFDAMLSGEINHDAAAKAKIVRRLVGLSNVSFRLLESSRDQSLGGFPQLGTTAAMGGALGAQAAREILGGNRKADGRHVISLRPASKFGPQTTTLEIVAAVRRARRKSQ